MITESIYRGESFLAHDDGRSLLGLETALAATPTGLLDHPEFFAGHVARPAVVAAGLLTVADVAATRYVDLSALAIRNLDPVVTASGDRLRFESFSGCNGVYARLDLLADGLDSGTVGYGTTNVDIGQPLRSALIGLDRHALLHLAVGGEELRVSTLEATHVERKVAMPHRWIRGFAEAPTLAVSMTPVFDVPGPVAATFLAGLTSAAPGPNLTIAYGPRGLRPTARTTPGGIPVAGTGRLTAARRVARLARRVTVHANSAGDTAWVFELPGARLTLQLTAGPYRGFSGEGSLLTALTLATSRDAVHRVHEQLAWEPTIDPTWLAKVTALDRAGVDAALAVLATSGKVGFDLTEHAWFQRELPFDDELVIQDNPRLVAARALVAEGLLNRVGNRWRVGAVDPYRWVEPVGTGWSCTCPWWIRYRGDRGPCKHVLAVIVDQAQSESPRTGPQAPLNSCG